MAEPSRRLVPASRGSKPARYVPACQTDVRRTFRRARLLLALQRRTQEQA